MKCCFLAAFECGGVPVLGLEVYPIGCLDVTTGADEVIMMFEVPGCGVVVVLVPCMAG